MAQRVITAETVKDFMLSTSAMYAASLDAANSISRTSQQRYMQNTITTNIPECYNGNSSSTQPTPTSQTNLTGSKQSTFIPRPNCSIPETEISSATSMADSMNGSNSTHGTSSAYIRISRLRGQADTEYQIDDTSQSKQIENGTLYNAIRTPILSTLPNLQDMQEKINATNGQLKETVEHNSSQHINSGGNQSSHDINNDRTHHINLETRNGSQMRTFTNPGSKTQPTNIPQFNIVRTKRVVSPEPSTTSSSKKFCNVTQKQCNTDQITNNSKLANESKRTPPSQQVFDERLTITRQNGNQNNQTRFVVDEPDQNVGDKDLPAFAFYKWDMFDSPNDPIFFIAVYSSEWADIKIILHLVMDTMSQDDMKGIFARGIMDAKMMSTTELEHYLCNLYKVQADKIQESAQTIAKYQQKPFSTRLKQYSDPSLQIFHKPTITLQDVIDLERKNKNNFDIMVKTLAEEKRLNTRRLNDSARRSLEQRVQRYEIQARMEEYLERLHVNGNHPSGEQVHGNFGLLYARLHSMIQTNLPKYELATQIINNPDQLSFANKMVTAILEFRNYNTDQFFA